MNDAQVTQSPGTTGPDTGLTIRQYYVMVGIGAFVTTIAQPAVIGRLPFSLLLKTQLHFNAETLALFMFIATFAWNVKPILTDRSGPKAQDLGCFRDRQEPLLGGSVVHWSGCRRPRGRDLLAYGVPISRWDRTCL